MPIATKPLAPRLGEGVYTLPDAALILRLPLTRLRHWVGGYFDAGYVEDDGFLATWGRGRARGFNFLVLIEAYTVYNLRRLGVSTQRIRVAREILGKHLETAHPFAARGILASGGRVLFDLEASAPGALLQLSPGKQTELRDIIEPFCDRLDFDPSTKLTERFWPCGREAHPQPHPPPLADLPGKQSGHLFLPPAEEGQIRLLGLDRQGLRGLARNQSDGQKLCASIRLRRRTAQKETDCRE